MGRSKKVEEASFFDALGAFTRLIWEIGKLVFYVCLFLLVLAGGMLWGIYDATKD